MSAVIRTLGLLCLLGSLAFGAAEGTITGTIKDPAGAPFRGAFIRAWNQQTKISINVLSDNQGRYRIQNLPPGEYDVRIMAVGYKSDPHNDVKMGAGATTSLDFSLAKTPVRWSDLSLYQGWQLLPAGRGKEILQKNCVACHGFQSRMAAVRRDAAGWEKAVGLMRTAMHSRLGERLNDQDWSDVTAYLNSVFGVDSKLPKSPADMPQYKETLRPISDEGLKIQFTEYDMPGPTRFPFSGAPDKAGNIWIPEFGRANKIARLDPKTGMMQEFLAPHQGTADIHSAWPAPDGTVWMTQQGSNKLGKWDPIQKEIREYQDAYKPGHQGSEDGGSKHTVRVDFKGNAWSSGLPLTKFDPKTGKFTQFTDIGSTYDVTVDKDGNVWFTNGPRIGRVDANTGKITRWDPPTANSFPRRIQIDPTGIVWFGEYNSGKIGRFDPKTETFKEFMLPGPRPTPYALGIDKNNYIWYSSDELDTLGRLDPKTGQVTEYPFPYSENFLKELIMDSEGRMWYGSPTNNKVGYFNPPAGG